MIISINAEYHCIHLTYLLQLMFPPCLVTLEVFRSPYVPKGLNAFSNRETISFMPPPIAKRAFLQRSQRSDFKKFVGSRSLGEFDARNPVIVAPFIQKIVVFYGKPGSKAPVNTMVQKKRGNKWFAALPVISFSFTQSIRLVISFSSDCPSARPGWAGGPYNTPLSRNSHRALGAHRTLRTCRSRCSPFSSRTDGSCGACGALRPSGAGRSCNTRCPWAARLTAPAGSSHFPAITAINNMLIHKIISPFCRILYSMNKTPSGA